MIISATSSGYFQKSKAFLLPALFVKKEDHTESLETYIAWETNYDAHDRRLILVKENRCRKTDYLVFEQEMLFENRMFEHSFHLDSDKVAYVFNFKEFKEDWNHFLSGQYSKLSEELKNRIRD